MRIARSILRSEETVLVLLYVTFTLLALVESELALTKSLPTLSDDEALTLEEQRNEGWLRVRQVNTGQTRARTAISTGSKASSTSTDAVHGTPTSGIDSLTTTDPSASYSATASGSPLPTGTSGPTASARTGFPSWAAAVIAPVVILMCAWAFALNWFIKRRRARLELMPSPPVAQIHGPQAGSTGYFGYGADSRLVHGGMGAESQSNGCNVSFVSSVA
ncbi:hypothetical protein TWF281_010857 [Arthrobotrys megalospora]